MDEYNIKLRAFEGPLSLLIHLIEKNKINLYDIPIATLTEQYLDHLERFKAFNIEVASEFIVMAATLLQIKSRMMLPRNVEIEGDLEEDPRFELVERLLEYQRYQKVSAELSAMIELQGRYCAREPLPLPVHHLPPNTLSLEELWEAFRTLLQVKEELKFPDALVSREIYSIEDKILEIQMQLIEHQGKVRFQELFQMGKKGEVIATFLALLELIKQKIIFVRQAAVFSDIFIYQMECPA